MRNLWTFLLLFINQSALGACEEWEDGFFVELALPTTSPPYTVKTERRFIEYPVGFYRPFCENHGRRVLKPVEYEHLFDVVPIPKVCRKHLGAWTPLEQEVLRVCLRTSNKSLNTDARDAGAG